MNRLQFEKIINEGFEYYKDMDKIICMQCSKELKYYKLNEKVEMLKCENNHKYSFTEWLKYWSKTIDDTADFLNEKEKNQY